jgi:formylglycine-generating enzyme required for sulfatase activity
MGSNPSHFKQAGKDAPVEQVSWEDCQEFVKRLNAKEGAPEGTYRLPTEAEWEYACRAGSRTAFYSGDEESRLGEIAWYGSNSGSRTHEVGGKTPNNLGLFDMSGNVWEWCHDWYESDYYGSSPPADPSGPGSGSARVARGGSWCLSAGLCRSADRRRLSPGNRNDSLGCRLARTFPGPLARR